MNFLLVVLNLVGTFWVPVCFSFFFLIYEITFYPFEKHFKNSPKEANVLPVKI